MGAIISAFNKDSWGKKLVEGFEAKMWENPEPSPEIAKLYEEVGEAINEMPGILEALTSYQPCSEYIRLAMNEPDNQEHEDKAFREVTRNAVIIASFWRYSKKLEAIVPKLLNTIGVADQERQPLASKTPLVKQLAEIFQFVLKFDELKMLRPGVQNDFSFYRRSLSKHASEGDLEVRDDDASFISLFLAAHIPMMTALAKTVAAAYNADDEITDAVAGMANTMLEILREKKFPPEDPTNLVCVRAMVGAVVLFDHVEPEGAFHKRSPIFMTAVCRMLVRDFPQNFPALRKEAHLLGLVSAVKYSSMHFSDDSTPEGLSNLLDSRIM